MFYSLVNNIELFVKPSSKEMGERERKKGIDKRKDRQVKKLKSVGLIERGKK